MNRIILFTFLFFLTSCAGHVVVNPQGCIGSGVWSDWKDRSFFEVESGYWFSFDNREVLLKEMLNENNINCKKVTSLYIETKSDLFDIILGVIPFFGHQTIRITGYTNSFKDEGPAKD